ncbi:MAG: transglycosylase domain-containing protein [Candidatus Thioglobus sp.]|uniref:biosynthetic peptidoglycan transglycosylase n=1 Tax=Candidatus Thioglobus sp. TaxID=2026721 RepID=UPI0026048895|nr:biosynthetic peptidoglycan transglycosylase [Candidatus Thioglobus sp.]MDC9727084.1 transglycosylase domain-containing protein [Candidatus Thioglobus sp.]
MSNFFLKGLKYATALCFVAFILYVNELDNQVKKEFSKPQNPNFLSFEQQSKVVINMLLLTEDQSFFNHFGVDFKEIARVVRDYVFYDKPLRGASTLTQQLIKNELLTRERTLDRKLKEIVMALLLEAAFDKEFILNYYLNHVYLGQKGNLSVKGFDQAAQFYFNKSVKHLSLEEVATLVALVKGPSYYHPVRHPQRLAKRRQLVLRLYNKYEKIVK